MAKYCLPGLDVAHTPTLGHQTSKQLTCPKDADCLRVPKPDPCKPVGPVRALSCVPGYVDAISHNIVSTTTTTTTITTTTKVLLLCHYMQFGRFRGRGEGEGEGEEGDLPQ